MLRNIIKHIQFRFPHFRILRKPTKYEKRDIEYNKYLVSQNIDCPHCYDMEKKRRSVDNWER